MTNRHSINARGTVCLCLQCVLGGSLSLLAIWMLRRKPTRIKLKPEDKEEVRPALHPSLAVLSASHSYQS